MSTITKLDRNVRLDRYLRKEQRRQMETDLKSITGFIVRGLHQLKLEEIISKRPDYSAQTRKLLDEMFVRRTVTSMMLKEISKICRDPRRTGERKEAILAKLGGEDVQARPHVNHPIDAAAVPLTQASTPVVGI